MLKAMLDRDGVCGYVCDVRHSDMPYSLIMIVRAGV